MIHDHEYNIGDELYFFDGRACTFKHVKIINKHESSESYYFIDVNGNECCTHRYYFYDTKDDVIEEIRRHIDTLNLTIYKLQTKE